MSMTACQSGGCPMTCTKCGIDDYKTLKMVYASGTSNLNLKTRGAGCNPFTILLFPFIGFWSLLFSSFGASRTTGTQQSLISAEATPPERKSLVGSLVVAVIGLFLLGGGGKFLGLILLVLGGLSTYAAITYNSRTFPRERAAWENSVMCQRCGNIYMPGLTAVQERPVSLPSATSQPLPTSDAEDRGDPVRIPATEHTQAVPVKSEPPSTS